MASGSGGDGSSAPHPGCATAWLGTDPPPAPASARDCESCRSAPGIPFCRVEWSFLCSGCAAVIHCHNWVVAVTPSNPNPSPSLSPNPTYSFHPEPRAVVQVSSGEEEASAGGGRRGGRPRRRVESVMRYREKRKSRMFEKTVRYESRKAHADLRPRVDGKFVRRVGTNEEARPMDAGEEVRKVGETEGERQVDGDQEVGNGSAAVI